MLPTEYGPWYSHIDIDLDTGPEYQFQDGPHTVKPVMCRPNGLGPRETLGNKKYLQNNV